MKLNAKTKDDFTEGQQVFYMYELHLPCVLQMDITMLADHIMEASPGRLKQETMETETDSGKVGISRDVRLLSGYLGEVER